MVKARITFLLIFLDFELEVFSVGGVGGCCCSRFFKAAAIACSLRSLGVSLETVG